MVGKLDRCLSRMKKNAIKGVTYLRVLLRNKNKSGMIGAMFPRTQIGNTWLMGMPIQTPTGTAPRSSTTGMAEIVANTAHLGRPKFMKKLAIFCPVCRCSAPFVAAAAKAGDVNKVKESRLRAAPSMIFRVRLLSSGSFADRSVEGFRSERCNDGEIRIGE